MSEIVGALFDDTGSSTDILARCVCSELLLVAPAYNESGSLLLRSNPDSLNVRSGPANGTYSVGTTTDLG